MLHTGQDLSEWLAAHPDGFIVIVCRGSKKAFEDTADFVQPYRGRRRIGLWKASDLLTRSTALDELAY